MGFGRGDVPQASHQTLHDTPPYAAALMRRLDGDVDDLVAQSVPDDPTHADNLFAAPRSHADDRMGQTGRRCGCAAESEAGGLPQPALIRAVRHLEREIIGGNAAPIFRAHSHQRLSARCRSSRIAFNLSSRAVSVSGVVTGGPGAVEALPASAAFAPFSV